MVASNRWTFAGGWLGSDDINRGLAARHPTLFRAAPTLAADDGDGGPILLYRAFRDVLGRYPAYPGQEVGDCVGHGHGRGLDMLQCVEIALGADTGFRESSTEFIYGVSREVAGILGDRDGSYGSAAVTAMTTIGVASRATPGCEGLYSGERADRWGREGVPAEIKAQASGMRLGSAARITTWTELLAAMKNGYPVTVCSTQGFAAERDREGFCPPEGVWGHCMLIAGVRDDRPGACILQSWGPDEPTGPTSLDQPSYSFWADKVVVEGMLAQGDSWALSGAPRFVSRTLPEHWSYHRAA
jgi:hypothetical protein